MSKTEASQGQVAPPASEEFMALMAQTQKAHTPNLSGGASYPPNGRYNWLLSGAESKVIQNREGTKSWAVELELVVIDGEHEKVKHPGPPCDGFYAWRIDNLLKIASLLAGESVTDQADAREIVLQAGEAGDRVLQGSISRNTRDDGRVFANVRVDSIMAE